MEKLLIKIPHSGPILGRPGGIIGPILNPYYEEAETVHLMVKLGVNVVEVDPKNGKETKLTIDTLLERNPKHEVEAAPAAPAPVEKPAEEEKKEQPAQQQNVKQNRNNGQKGKNNQPVEDAATKK